MNISSLNIKSRANCQDNNYALRLALKKRLMGTLKSSPQRNTDILRVNNFGKTFNFQCD